MKKVTDTLNTEEGIHARPASLLVKEASKYGCEIVILKDGNSYNAKSIMNILSMGASKGDELIITAEGENEEEAVEAIKALIESNFK